MGKMRNQRWDEFLVEVTDEAEMQFNKAVIRHQNRVKKRRNDFSLLPHRRRSTFRSQFASVPDGNWHGYRFCSRNCADGWFVHGFSKEPGWAIQRLARLLWCLIWLVITGSKAKPTIDSKNAFTWYVRAFSLQQEVIPGWCDCILQYKLAFTIKKTQCFKPSWCSRYKWATGPIHRPRAKTNVVSFHILTSLCYAQKRREARIGAPLFLRHH